MSASPLTIRMSIAHLFLKPIPPRFCIVWDHPEDDGPASVTVPSPEWLAMALHGGILPPAECYLRDGELPAGAPPEHPYAPPIGPMSEEQAMLYLLLKDVPRAVWEVPSNRPRYAIVSLAQIPTDRTHRNAWCLTDYQEAA